VQKDILSNNDYKTLFISTNVTEESTSKLPEDNVIYSFENDNNNEEEDSKHKNNAIPEYEEQNNNNHDEKMNFMNFNSEHFEPFLNNEKENEFNMYLNNQHPNLFEDDQEMNNSGYKMNTFKVKCDEESPLLQTMPSSATKSMNQIFSTVFSSDNNSSNSTSTNNAKFFAQKTNQTLAFDRKAINNNKAAKNNLCNKRNREDSLNKFKPNAPQTVINKNINSVIDNLPINNNLGHNINFAVLNPQNLASLQNLLPNLNLLSQNIGVVNWVVPMNNVSNEEN